MASRVRYLEGHGLDPLDGVEEHQPPDYFFHCVRRPVRQFGVAGGARQDRKEPALPLKEAAEHFRNREDEVAVRHGGQDRGQQLLRHRGAPLRLAARAEVARLAGEGHEVAVEVKIEEMVRPRPFGVAGPITAIVHLGQPDVSGK